MSASPAESFPLSLRQASRWIRLGGVPVVIVHPAHAGMKLDGPAPLLLWFHGRTVNKELDPGRYARLLRIGIATCAVDLPGHGERREESRQGPDATLGVVQQAVGEIDPLLEELRALGGIDMKRVAIGGMSAGGMVSMVRCCREHPFRALLLEGTTGSWSGPSGRAWASAPEAMSLEPIRHLEHWRDIPVLALHNTHDEWVDVAAQREFMDRLRQQSANPERINLHEYPRGGAPAEHAGFGRFGADAKDRAATFLAQWLSSAA